jgi:recombination protein RecA
MRRTTPPKKISEEVKSRVTKPKDTKPEYEGNTESMISTGSTLLDLAISGGRVRGGGIPCGIMVEIFGPESTGKTVLLCEIAGDIQRKDGEVMFHDPEARLNAQFARIFDLDPEGMTTMRPDTVTGMFIAIRDWIPDNKKINGVMADSLAALSTDMELGEEEGDKMGMRRAKEFSEQLRRTARILSSTNTLMVCSNQIREDPDRVGRFSPKYKSPGGKAIAHYGSLRLKTSRMGVLSRTVTIRGKKIRQVYGIEIEVEVAKSSVWKPHRKAPVTIDFDYGVDDIRENLKYIKDFAGTNIYSIGDQKLGGNLPLPKAIEKVEKEGLEEDLRNEVINLWEEIEEEFKVERKPKKR